ncbi:MAG: fasciclin domain-containing protein [Phycisphaeraceae bacterium]
MTITDTREGKTIDTTNGVIHVIDKVIMPKD